MTTSTTKCIYDDEDITNLTYDGNDDSNIKTFDGCTN